MCLVHIAAEIYFSHIDELLTPTEGNLVRVLLVGKGLEACFDRVHGVATPRHLSSDVVDTNGAEHLKQTMRRAESETCDSW
jgi:hypothetical protein